MATAGPPANNDDGDSTPRGRFAPSPTGLLHVGNARTALIAWLSVRSRGGGFAWRLEDLDPPRIVAGAAEAAVRDLAWLGLDWDEDPERGGPHAPYVQSQRSDVYEAALAHLHEAGRLFPCTLSRRELETMASAPHGADDEAPYPAAARPARLDPGWFERVRGEGGAALRLRVDAASVRFADRVHGELTQATGGDFVLKRRDGLYAYQLAVVVDDWLMRMTEVVRGADLLPSTARQIHLAEALGARPPAHAHVPMVLAPDGRKLSKRDDGLTVEALRREGITPAALCGYLAWSAGLLDRPEAVAAHELVASFAWTRVSREPFVLPADLPARLAALGRRALSAR